MLYTYSIYIEKSKSALSKLARECKANTIEVFISLFLVYKDQFTCIMCITVYTNR